MAVKAGKDVYCEKPACYNIHEGQAMLAAQAETKKMIQIGSQHRSVPFKIKGMQQLHDGVIGDIYMSKGLCFKPRPSIGHKDEADASRREWDLFLGPLMRAFNELRFKYNWHWFWDTGNGDIGNQGVHEMGICRWGLASAVAEIGGCDGREVRAAGRSGDAEHAAFDVRLRRA